MLQYGKGKFITTVGPRKADQEELDIAFKLGLLLRRNGYGIRSGLAIGMDYFFMKGFASRDEKGIPRMEMYMPENFFRYRAHNDKQFISIQLMEKKEEALKIAEEIHPAWHNCSEYARWLHGRNIPQVLGKDLKSPSELLLTCVEEVSEGRCKGGTNTAYTLAHREGIPIVNYKGISDLDKIVEMINDKGIKLKAY